jgi:hypothetical protein
LSVSAVTVAQSLVRHPGYRAGCENFPYEFKAGPAGGLRPPSGPPTTRRSPGHRPHRHRSRHRHLTLIDTSFSPGFGHAKEKGPDCRQQRRDLAGIGARQSASVSVDPNGACRGGAGGAAGRGASRWPSQPAGQPPAGRPAAARRGFPRGIPRAATTRIESTR